MLKPLTAIVPQLAAGVTLAQGQAAPVSYSLQVLSSSPYAFAITNSEGEAVVTNAATLAGKTNTSMTAVSVDSKDTRISTEFITPSIVRVTTSTSTENFLCAQFNVSTDAKHYGVWSYPFNRSIINDDIAFDIKGLQGNDGINYASARSPFFIDSSGFAVYADTQAMGSYEFPASTSDGQGQISFRFDTTDLTYYIILPRSDGRDKFKSLLTQYASLTDPSPLWSPRGYGPMFWHNDFQRESAWPEGVSSAQEFVADVVDKLAGEKVRASAIMVDRPYGTGTEGWGNYDFDPAYWPDISGLISDVAEKGLDFQVWVANRAVPASKLHNQSLANDWLFLEAQTPLQQGLALNLSIPETYTYLQQQMNFFPELGVRGYKIDRGDENEMPIHEENRQTYLFHKLMYENQAAYWGGATPTKPAGFYTFARSVHDRSRQYTGVWAADPASTENGLAQSIRHGIRSGLLGFPMWGSDCGGYTRRVGDGRPSKDLWARWMWFSAFSPVYELMLYEGSIPWYDYSDDLMDVLRATAQLHTELIPFIQSYIYRGGRDGLPVIRALFLETPDDDNDQVWRGDQAYFFGAEFLVAPMTADTRTVYFPGSGNDKYLEYFSKRDVYKGGTEHTFTLNTSSVPAFVREGAIVPRGDLYRANNRWDEEWRPWLNVEVYPGYGVEESDFVYFDEGRGRTVDIAMVAEKRSKRVCVEYGALGVQGELRVYLKRDVKRFKLKDRGGKECIRGVETLFE
ncbi:uncharacterized protein DSM5745_06791 [Aspergillus mulundensis]|uniref:Glycoside hydrolase family 31 N-terminal domain-containing protein n=1 Tax=Aspergillus mulundensis TaxID=1810919 RepID=A0A3D8RRX0_9EURO|nr:Uncharacterized protein DSM5745_06791 [Aspergillus mulundensis]RDW76799.1 Uncharacterized protein DSM5745_06791 [Aspergillus mulundensis]